MPAVHFMPWCPLDRDYTIGEISLIPFDRTAKNERYDHTELSHVLSILSSYCDLAGQPNRKMSLVKYQERSVFSDLTSEEFEIARELVELGCFSGISKRTYFSFGDYCNASNFTFYGQKFALGSNHTAIVSRRRDGQNSSMRSIGKTIFSIPVQASPIQQVKLDEQLLTSLVAFRGASDNKEWSRWQNAIACFNSANTDADNVAYQVEWTLLCSAFERLLGADSKAVDVATKFSDVFLPTNPLIVGSATRKSSRWKDPAKSLSFEWMREFYSVRGDFAHGQLDTGQPLAWQPLEHLSLASIAFPLVVKCLLRLHGTYTLTDDDSTEIDAFECLADSPLSTDPPDSHGSLDSWWVRCRENAAWEATTKKAVEFLESSAESTDTDQGENVPYAALRIETVEFSFCQQTRDSKR